MLTSTALVLLMIPGLAMFYGGLVRTKNVLGTMHSFTAMGIISVLWVIVGYTMCFGQGQVGDGKIFVTPLEQCIRIRTRETGSNAI